jgi:hypothetical protein
MRGGVLRGGEMKARKPERGIPMPTLISIV